MRNIRRRQVPVDHKNTSSYFLLQLATQVGIRCPTARRSGGQDLPVKLAPSVRQCTPLDKSFLGGRVG
jgi:hypothetical protein